MVKFSLYTTVDHGLLCLANLFQTLAIDQLRSSTRIHLDVMKKMRQNRRGVTATQLFQLDSSSYSSAFFVTSISFEPYLCLSI